jgi:hypothetical protein
LSPIDLVALHASHGRLPSERKVTPALAEELVLNPAVTQAMIGGTICKPGWARRFGRLFA